MGSHTTLSDFLGNLRDDLSARVGLAGVTILTGSADDITVGEEGIVFAVDDVAVDIRPLTIPTREVIETYAVDGRIWIVKEGAGEDVIVAARERAVEILAEVHEALDAHVTTPESLATFGVDDVRITGYRLTQLVGDGYRDCRLTFVVTVKARFTPA